MSGLELHYVALYATLVCMALLEMLKNSQGKGSLVNVEETHK